MKFFIAGFFGKCNQIHRKMENWSHFLKKFVMKNFIFCAVQWRILKHFILFFYSYSNFVMYYSMQISSLSLVLFHTVIHKAGIAVKRKIRCIKSRHEKKIHKFRQRQSKMYRNDSRYYIKNTAHDFSPYVLSSNEELALANGLEQNIQVKLGSLESSLEKFSLV